MKSISQPLLKFHKGFTLIELIIVIIILGIMMVTVAPKFFSSNGFEQFTYRNEAITTLRAIQLRAMQQTSGDFCHQVSVTSSQLGLLKTDTSQVSNCHLTELSDQSNSEYNQHTSVSIDNNHDVTFSVNGLASTFGFNQMGRVTDINGTQLNCLSPNACQIIVTGDQTLIIQIENEGFIHAL
ncbi:prepilin-type N-terminal cleavage/methylation domain-containing protein [Thalassotalea piscium]|uniref:MSHA pilin protein MshC n=1 Tax=Thalassotalea piscium TaxID=1230533 RepID=A0A7X0TUT0_9GAMM|nr:prepilin-type N-terminal cleavage/methylation domain-containing protein [Thalassotalea piscium]MBB6544606.1 MSHA pilin protein MshC [Thalassotalea piscium]